MIKKITENKILFLIALFLIVFFFAGKCRSAKKETFYETSLLNPGNKNYVNNIILEKNNEKIEIKKINDYWIIKSKEYFIPADQEKIEAFLDKLSSIRKVYEYVNEDKNDEKLGLDENTRFTITVKNNDNTYTKLYTGINDFSRSYIYFKTSSSIKTYKTNCDFENFQNTLVSFWNDPYLLFKNLFNQKEISKCIATFDSKNYILTKESLDDKGYSLYSKLVDFRHGALCNKNEAEGLKNNAPEMTIRAFYDENYIEISFIKKSEEDYAVFYSENKLDLNCTFNLSRWSFLDLKTLFKSKVN